MQGHALHLSQKFRKFPIVGKGCHKILKIRRAGKCAEHLIFIDSVQSGKRNFGVAEYILRFESEQKRKHGVVRHIMTIEYGVAILFNIIAVAEVGKNGAGGIVRSFECSDQVFIVIASLCNGKIDDNIVIIGYADPSEHVVIQCF